MLILIGTVPTAYALNRTMPAEPDGAASSANSAAAAKVVEAKAAGYNVIGDPRAGGDELRRAARRSTKGPSRRSRP